MTKKGKITVKEAGHMGGLKGGPRGGNVTKKRYGHDFYEEIGRKGGQKVKSLINKGKQK